MRDSRTRILAILWVPHVLTETLIRLIQLEFESFLLQGQSFFH